jgi:transcriptional regulator with XRE-family HTH domain/Zn-dependent peptidase ImmA (M78 family)
MRDAHQARIGAQIASLRERQGWSQRALAKWVGIDQSAVSRIEAGRRRLSADELQRIAAALHVSADALLAGTRAAPAAVPARSAPAESRPSAGRSRTGLAQSMALQEDAVLSPRYRPSGAFPGEEGWDASLRRNGLSDSRRERRTYPIESRGDSRLPPTDGEITAPPASGDFGEAAGHEYDLSGHVSFATSAEPPAAPGLPLPAGLPEEVVGVVRDWLDLRRLADREPPTQPWSTGHSAEGKPERVPHPSAALRPPAPVGDVLYDRVARFWRSELHVDPDDGPLPDIVPLLEEGYGAQVVVARVAPARSPQARYADQQAAEVKAARAPAAADRPVAAAFTAAGVPFIFVNAARPVILQRFALAHAFAHLALGHGDVIDRRIEWNRTIPPEAAANDFAEELLAPVRAVQRWYERRSIPRGVRLEDLLELGNAFGISAWAALYRSRAAGRLQGKQFQALRGELERHEWQLLPRQAYLGGLKDSLAQLTPVEALPPGAYGRPAVLRVPAPMRAWALAALRGGRLSLEAAAAALRVEPGALAEELALLGLE